MISPAVALRPVRARDASLERLDARERAVVPARATPKRRAEFAAGRVAAHAALERLLGGDAAGAAVVPERGRGGGRPLAVDERGAAMSTHLSITHAAGLAAAAAAPVPVGIDLVALEPLGAAFLDEAFGREELGRWEAWTGAARSEAACVAFAAKEAALKWLGTGLELSLHALRVVPAGPGSASRLGGAIGALSLSVRVELAVGAVFLDGWVAASPRRALVAVCGPGFFGR